MVIKLKKLYEDVRPLKGTGIYDTAYHVSEEEVRNSIKKYGLDPSKYELNDRTTGGNYIYVFVDYNDTKWYVREYNSWLRYQGEPKKTFDIWQINTKNLYFIKDFTLNTENPELDSAYVLKSPVDKKLLKLIETTQ